MADRQVIDAVDGAPDRIETLDDESRASGQSAGAAEPETGEASAKPVYRLFGREFPKPGSRRARLALGGGLTVLGLFGFLPILGFWMTPLGLFVLSQELHPLRRIRRRLAVRHAKRQRAKRPET